MIPNCIRPGSHFCKIQSLLLRNAAWVRTRLQEPKTPYIAGRVIERAHTNSHRFTVEFKRNKHEVETISEIGERVKKIVVEHLGVEPDKVIDSASFIDDLGADSLDTVELVMAFEEEFGCEIPDDAAETILTVGDATKFLEKNAKS